MRSAARDIVKGDVKGRFHTFSLVESIKQRYREHRILHISNMLHIDVDTNHNMSSCDGNVSDWRWATIKYIPFDSTGLSPVITS